MQTEFGGGVPETTTFAQTLGSLKENGSNMLLVGSGETSAHEAACHRLLGKTEHESRYRLFVVTGEQRCRCPALETDDVVDGRRQVVTHGDPFELFADDVGAETASKRADPLGELGAAMIYAINEFDDDADGLEPSDLRVCVDSLVPLLQQYPSERVFRFLHMTTAQIKRAHGMGHYHLPVPRDHDAVNLFEPLFDAVVELRDANGTPEQRWHLRERNTSSDWIRI